MFFYLGFISCIPKEFKLPQYATVNDNIFHFQPRLSPISKENAFYDEDEVNRVKDEFFFQPEDLSARHIIQNPVDLQNKLLLIIKHLLGNATSEKNKKALEIAKIKFETCKTHMEIYDKIHPKDEYKKQNVKERYISGKLRIAKNLLKSVWPTFPNSKAEWESYFEDPAQYLNQDEVFRKSSIK